jgi:ABC-2 type transport system ATP-binding protein
MAPLCWLAGIRWKLAILLAVAALVAGAAVAITITMAPDPPPVSAENLTIDVPGGPGVATTVRLDATLYRPAVTPAPAVLVAHGFGGSKDSVSDQATALARRGFVVLAWTARGFGASTGQIALDSPDYEVADARALVDWLAKQPDVVRDAPGDPRVGVTGASYGGALALLLAGTDRRVDALAPEITWNDLAQALFPNAAGQRPIPSNTPAAGAFAPNGVFKREWAGYFFGVGASGAGPCGRFRPEICAAYVQAATTGGPTPQIVAMLHRSSPATVASTITAPTLLIQGAQDTLFGLDQADATARQLAAAGAPLKVIWYAGGHDGAPPTAALQDQVGDWFAYHLRGIGTNPGTGFDYQMQGIFGTRRDLALRTVHAAAYPGLGGASVQHRELILHGTPQQVVRPPGGSPAALSSLPGLNALRGGAANLDGVAMDVPGQSAMFVTDPLRDPVEIVGAPRIRLRVAATPTAGVLSPAEPAIRPPAEAVLFVKLYDLGPDGRRTLPGGAVAPVRIGPLPAGGTPVEFTVTLAGVVRPVQAGHRLIIAVATTDRGYALPPQSAGYTVSLGDEAKLAVPVVAGEQAAGPLPTVQLVGLGGLAAVVAASGVIAALGRRRAEDADPELADVPLVVTGLTKRYPGDLTAVDELSFRLEHGQVLGLLGPNGAGKTTVLRMLMGLIQPTSGELRAFGHRVAAGAAVLSRIGSFVEGPGFLPHLTGIDNLRLYWAATGRPSADAGIDEALAIAGLGHAVHRRVATYSHGMRQRLAIAQAMLGRPDLLVLDEPTNGLDPPQIHAMREVLRAYAARGATVLVSSHLLAEVEQICSHVVVMHRGRLVAAGTVADIVAGTGTVSFTVDDPAQAAAVLSALTGVDVMGVNRRVVHAHLDGLPCAAAVTALVGAGIGVEGVAAHQALEEAFLQLVRGGAVE